MARAFFILGLGLSTILLASQPVRAESAICGERDVIVARLAEFYGEHPRAIGLAAGNQLVELFASPETGTWTITVTAPTGIACLMAAGEEIEWLDGAPLAEGDPA